MERLRTRSLALWLALCQALVPFVGVSPALAQDGSDDEPPQIVFEPLLEGRQGDTQVFSARIRDDVGVVGATLYYRLSADAPYGAVPMEAIGGTDVHLVSLKDIDEEATLIQFYIEARDAAGNRGFEGFAFDPIERRLVPPGVPLAASTQATEAVPAEGMSTGRKVLYGVLGLIAVGVLASAVGGGDSGGSGGPLADPVTDVPIELIVDPLR